MTLVLGRLKARIKSYIDQQQIIERKNKNKLTIFSFVFNFHRFTLLEV